MFLKLFLLVLLLVAVALAGLGISMLIRKKGKFPETHIGRNQQMKERGIHCASTTDALERRNYRPVKPQEKEKEE
ncbi:MAG: hypothetical protein LBR65_02135 [Culturomica sp.]|jgi:hypothetical protein|nr:hypothetical protein [Culturomica sp.]